jgi:hypothetical protein
LIFALTDLSVIAPEVTTRSSLLFGEYGLPLLSLEYCFFNNKTRSAFFPAALIPRFFNSSFNSATLRDDQSFVCAVVVAAAVAAAAATVGVAPFERPETFDVVVSVERPLGLLFSKKSSSSSSSLSSSRSNLLLESANTRFILR